MNSRILVVDDEKDLGWAICEKLRREGYEAEQALSGEEAVELAQKEKFALAIIDYQLPGMDGLETIKRIKETQPGTALIFITAYGDHDLAWKSLESGADEYINKPFNLRNLSFFIYKIIRTRAMENEIKTLRDRTNQNRGITGIIYRSPAMDNIVKRIDIISRASTTVLITGETGAGKDLIATAIHHHTANPRKDAPFVAINCAAIPEPLIESELFGHTRDAFTGAVMERKGVFEAADGGTLLLDEISSASPALQQKLLRAIETGEFYSVGDVKVKKTDVFIIAASNRNLRHEVNEGRFREDLYQRLKVIQIDVPPLRERIEDIEPLCAFFLGQFNKLSGKSVTISDNAIASFKAYSWPGNVRELRNTIMGLVTEKDVDRIDVDNLPARMTEVFEARKKGSFSELKSSIVEDFEKNYFMSLLSETRGNVSEAARRAGMARVNIIKKLKALELDPARFRTDNSPED